MKTKTFKKKEFDFTKHGCFFAFGDKQFDEQKKKGIKYVAIDGGLVCPKSEANTIWSKFDAFNKVENKRELEFKGKEKVIRYELSNYECWYTGDYSDAVAVLSGYGITVEEVREVFNRCKNECRDF